MTGYFLCEIVQGAPLNCIAIPAERTMQISEMITIISVLWAAIGVAFVARLIGKQLST